MPVALTVPLRPGPARHPVPWVVNSSGISRAAPDYPRIPAAVTSPKWLWLTLAMTRPETVRPH